MRVPVHWHLWLGLLWRDILLHGRHHDLDGERDDLTLAILIPTVMLYEELQHVVDIDNSTVERSGNLGNKRLEGSIYPFHGFLIVLFLHRYLHLKSTIRPCACRTALEFQIDEVLNHLAISAMFIARQTLISSHKLELEVFDVFRALSIVSDHSNLRYLAQIVLVLVEEDLRDGRCTAREAQATTNLTFEVELEVKLRCLNRRPVDIDLLGSSEGRYFFIVVSPVMFVFRCELGV